MEAKALQNKLITLAGLLRQYEGYLEKWQKIAYYVKGDVVGIEYYGYRVVAEPGGSPKAYRDFTCREFTFSEKELDKAIDRFRKKIAYEKNKRDGKKDV